MKKFLAPCFLLLAACSSEGVANRAEQVTIVRNKDDLDKRCRVRRKMELRSSTFSRKEESELRKGVVEAGGDTVYIYDESDEESDITTYGYVLRCHGPQTGSRKKAAAKVSPPAPTEPLPEPPPPAVD